MIRNGRTPQCWIGEMMKTKPKVLEFANCQRFFSAAFGAKIIPVKKGELSLGVLSDNS
jgi:hypothetical protein